MFTKYLVPKVIARKTSLKFIENTQSSESEVKQTGILSKCCADFGIEVYLKFIAFKILRSWICHSLF